MLLLLVQLLLAQGVLPPAAPAGPLFLEAGDDPTVTAFPIVPVRPEEFFRRAAWEENPELSAAFTALERTADADGVTLRLDVGAPAYGYAWPGHDPDETHEHRGEFAQGVGRALVTAMPHDGRSREVAVLTRDPLNASELWRRLLAGLLEGLAGRPDLTMTWLTAFGADELPPPAMAAYAERMEAAVRVWAPGAGEAWRQRGGLGFRLPREAGAASPEAWPARLLSRRYAWRERPLSDDDAARDASLPPLERLRRAGPCTFAGRPAYALLGPEGALVAVWRPEGAAVPLDRLGRNARAIPFDGTEPYALSADARRLPTSLSPVLVAPAPVRQWGGPQCLRLALFEPAAPKGDIPFAAAFSNRLGSHIEGVLAARLPATLEAPPLPQTISLGPGETYRADGRLRGAMRLGETFRIQLTLAHGTGIIASPSRPIRVQPALKGRWADDAPVTALTRAPLDGKTAYAAASASGRLTVFDPSGGELWTRWADEPLAAPLVVFRHWTGALLLTAVTNRGKLSVYDARGVKQWDRRMGAPAAPAGLVPADLHPFPGQELVFMKAFGGLTALLSNGHTLWERPLEDIGAGIAALDVPGTERQGVFAAAGGSSPALIRLDSAGRPVFRTPLPAGPSSPPASAAWNDRLVIATGLETGAIARVDGLSGEPLPLLELPGALPVTGLAAYIEERQLRYLAASPAGLFCVGEDADIRWALDAPCSLAPALTADAIFAPLDDGATACLTYEGDVLWLDRRPVLPQSATPLVAPAGDERGVVTASLDGALRCLDLGP